MTSQEDKMIKIEKSDDGDESNTSVQSKLDTLENNVNFLMKLGEHQDKLLKQATSELVRLNRLVLDFTGRDSNGTPDFEVYVANMSPQTTPDMMREHFKRFGTVVDAFILRTHLTSQCGIVKFSEKEMAAAAVARRSSHMDGRRIFIKKSFGSRGGHQNKENISQSLIDQKAVNSVVKSMQSSSKKLSRYSPY